MLPLDVVIILIFLIFAIRGLMRGLVRELCGLFSLLFSLFLAHTFYIKLAKKVAEVFQISPSMSIFVAFVLIFIGVYILFFIASYFIQLLVKAVHLGFMDKISGAVLGSTKVLVLLVIFSLLISQFPLTSSLSCSLSKKSHIYAWINTNVAKKQILGFISQHKVHLRGKL